MQKFRINEICLYSLKGYNCFSDVFLNSKRFYSKNLMLSVVFADSPKKDAHYGVTISKRLANKAVVRNRVKRLLRESLRLIIKLNYENLFFDKLILVYKKKVLKAGDVNLNGIYPEVLELLKKAEAFYNENNS